MLRKICAAWLVWLLTFAPVASYAGRYSAFNNAADLPNVPEGTLPTGFNVAVPSGVDPDTVAEANYSGDTLTIHQKTSKVIIDWESFNIGKGATTYFEQQGNSSWAALNRIHDQNPSQIYGTLKADGHIYLINQNGILFGEGSQVNVGSLTASTLNISDTNFINNNLTFQAEDYMGLADYAATDSGYGIRNQGTITATEVGGRIFLLGQKVVNEDTISATAGQIGLAAGTKVLLEQETESQTRIELGYRVNVVQENAGEVVNQLGRVVLKETKSEGKNISNENWNYLENLKRGEDVDIVFIDAEGNEITINEQNWENVREQINNQGLVEIVYEGGALEANLGLIGMYGNEVYQNWDAMAATSPEKASQIELMASKLVSTGENSRTSTPITPSTETYVVDKNIQVDANIKIHGISYDSEDTVARVEHRGIIDAPSGNVTIDAGERVYLAEDSIIDVSGLWVTKGAESLVLETTLNSLELRDYFAQKGGILQGQTIRFLATEGSAIGDVSGVLNTQEQTAAELATTGGTIIINSGLNQEAGNTADIIVRDGALLDFSGGGIEYDSGTVEVTGLVSGSSLPDIASASQWGRYSATKNVEKYIPDHVAGADAGILKLIAPRIVLDGVLKGQATIGAYQIYDNKEEAKGLLSLLRPKGGFLQLGELIGDNNSPGDRDAILESVRVVDSTTSLSDFSESDELNENQINIISARKIEEAGLGSLTVSTNGEFTLAENAEIGLQAGGSLSVYARRIIQEGRVYVPSGDLAYSLLENVTSTTEADPRYGEYESRFYLGEKAVIDVSGERNDNRLVSGSDSIVQGILDGGTVTISDLASPVCALVLAQGSRIDVSGGYQWSEDGDIEGGDAGSLTIQGDALFLDGELTGLALIGQTGSELNLHASDLTVTAALVGDSGMTADSELPPGYEGLVLSTTQLRDSGFTRINLKSARDLIVKSGVHLQPSVARLQPGSEFNTETSAEQSRYEALGIFPSSTAWQVPNAADGQPLPGYLGASTITLASGKPIDAKPDPSVPEEETRIARTIVESGATLSVGPTGQIGISGPGVEINGVLEALAGEVNVTASSTFATLGYDPLILGEEARILAGGWNEPGTAPASGLVRSQSPHDGGSVTITSSDTLLIAEGAVVDVSAAPDTRTWIRDKYHRLNQVPIGGDPGEITLSFANLELGGQLLAKAYRASGQGGSLTLINTDLTTNWSLDSEDFDYWLAGGFDALTLRGYSGLSFNGEISARLDRSLVLDTTRITAGEDADVWLESPWVRLINSVGVFEDADAVAIGEGQLVLAGEWIDLVGDLQLSGFDNVYLGADRELRVSDFDYQLRLRDDSDSLTWSGKLAHSGDLIMTGRIFPEVPDDLAGEFAAFAGSGLADQDSFSSALTADFKFQIGGKITTLPGSIDSTRALTSAGGSITLEAGGGIEHRGTIEAPYGTVALIATGEGDDENSGRVYLAPGSLLRTTGSGATAYGTLADGTWFNDTKDTSASERDHEEVTEALGHGVTISGEQVLMAEGAQIDVSGGGAIFAYQFQPGVDGSTNPLSGALIVVPDPDQQLPGEAVYLQGVEGVADGVYSVVSEDYALVASAYTEIRQDYTRQSGQKAELAAESAALAVENEALAAGAEDEISAAQYTALAEQYRQEAADYGRQAEQYALMAEQYAELADEYSQFENALVLADLGTIYQAGGAQYTEEGYRIVAGYQTWQGTDIDAAALKSYSVRKLRDLLAEGDFEVAAFAQGDAGSISLLGETTVVDGTLNASPLEGLYTGGSMTLSGAEVVVTASSQGTSAIAWDEFGFADGLSAEHLDTLLIDGGALSGFAAVELGQEDKTTKITLEEGSELQVAGTSLTLTCGKNGDLADGENGIYLMKDSTIEAGEVTFNAPDVEVVLGEGSKVHVSDALNLATNDLELRGDGLEGHFQIDNSTVNLLGKRIVFVEGDDTGGEQGLVITREFWSLFENIANIGLKSESDIAFNGSFNLEVNNQLYLDEARLVGNGGDVRLAAQTIILGNSGQKSNEGSAEDIGNLTLVANVVQMANGDVRTDGFRTINIEAAEKVSVTGQGSFTLDGDLTVSTPLVKVTGERNSLDTYEAADYLIDGGIGTVAILGGDDGIPEAGNAGGRFEIAAGTIRVDSIVDNTAGTTTLNGSDSVSVEENGKILNRGNAYFSGGRVQVIAEDGEIDLAAGSLIDVSGGAQGDAGSIKLVDGTGGVNLAGELRGRRGSENGHGGSFDMDIAAVADFSSLNTQLHEGGFDERIAVRARSGDLNIAAADIVRAQEVYLAADAGGVSLAGTLDASGDSGGTVELHSGQDLTLASGSLIDVSGDAGEGGSVVLNSRDGWVNMASGALIDASGSGQGGSIHFRAAREDGVAGSTGINLQGTIIGADKVIAEGVETYSVDGPLNQIIFNSYLADAEAWIANAEDLFDNLALESTDIEALQLRAGIEATSDGNLTVGALNLSDSNVLGNLVVRAAGNMTVTGTVRDGNGVMTTSPVQDSWGISLVAGADPAAADFTATVRDTGTLTIGNNLQVYSESGPVTLAAGDSIHIGTAAVNGGTMISSAIPFNIGSYSGAVEVRTEGNLTINGGVIQTATGDIDLRIGGNLSLNQSGNTLGTVRTLGEAQAGATDYWDYDHGGDVFVDVDGSIIGGYNRNGWDKVTSKLVMINGRRVRKYSWQPSYDGSSTTQGLATLGGGNLTVRTGADFTTQAGTFGSGNFTLSAGGDLSGRFLNRQGTASIASLGNIGATDDQQSFEILDTVLQVTAQGDLHASVVDPFIAHPDHEGMTSSSTTWTLGMTEETSMFLQSIGGDVVLYGEHPIYPSDDAKDWWRSVLPATVVIQAGRDIVLKQLFGMLPSSEGNLQLVAGRDIRAESVGQTISGIIMNDDDPADVYATDGSIDKSQFFSAEASNRNSDLHKDDGQAIEITAGRNIENIAFRLPKMAHITAGGDIRYLRYVGQNFNEDDVSLISASNSIVVESALKKNTATESLFGIEQGGPGALIVQAGYSLDLGTSRGIVASGSAKNSALGSEGADLLVLVGYDTKVSTTDATENFSLEDAAVFFAALKVYGQELVEAQADGRTADANAIVEKARSELIEMVFGPAPGITERQAGRGYLKMVESLISTTAGASNIYIAAAGDIDVGRSSINDSGTNKGTGIFTTAGGDISILNIGDLNVFESRVMTYGGSDIFVWADQGDINAGRGSRTAISQTDKTIYVDEYGEYRVSYSPPAVGSGIRALTYDPDGVAGIKEKPDPGDIILVAPEGIIDAGEAGIAGGRILLAATEVRNAQNISFSLGSVGVPTSSGTSGLGALAGVSSLTEVSSLVEQAASFGPRDGLTPAKVVDDFLGKWLDVEVTGFVL
ncbi:MAG: filamentous hemagglutinin family protein [Syntrophotaleaceae bacterium]